MSGGFAQITEYPCPFRGDGLFLRCRPSLLIFFLEILEIPFVGVANQYIRYLRIYDDEHVKQFLYEKNITHKF